MQPDFGIGLGQEHGRRSQRPRPSLFVRLLEAAGLLLVAYGLGSYRAIPVAVGVVLILGSYAVYRRTHSSLPPAAQDWSFDGPDGGGD